MWSFVALLAVLLAMPPHVAAQGTPSAEELLVTIRDLGLPVDQVSVRNSVSSDAGASCLLELGDGTLIDARLVRAADGWSVRDFSLVAGNADSFRSWTSRWRERVAAAEDFLASVNRPGQVADPRELAPLFWFEDPDERDRLWGMNPVTYRVMQALQMMPPGPMQGGARTNPVPRRDDGQ